jgi:ERCC4-type nuclease
MSILCDTREREIIQKFPDISTRTLSVGDIWIGISGEDVRPGGIVAERKTVQDFEASILDGRYREQRTRLLTYCQQQSARPLYIIEGSLDRITGRLADDVLRQYLNRLQLRYGVAVMHTDCVISTMDLCQILSKQIIKDSTVFVLEDGAQKAYTHVVSVVKKTNRDDPKTFASLMLQQCPGLSATLADALLKAFGETFKGVYEASVLEIAAVKVTEKRKVGPALAKRLFCLLHP